MVVNIDVNVLLAAVDVVHLGTFLAMRKRWVSWTEESLGKGVLSALKLLWLLTLRWVRLLWDL